MAWSGKEKSISWGNKNGGERRDGYAEWGSYLRLGHEIVAYTALGRQGTRLCCEFKQDEWRARQDERDKTRVGTRGDKYDA